MPPEIAEKEITPQEIINSHIDPKTINPKQEEWFAKADVKWLKDDGTVIPPKDYLENLKYRIWVREIEKKGVDDDHELKRSFFRRAKLDVLFFFNTFLWTHDTRKTPADLPFITYKYEDEFIAFINGHIQEGKDCFTEKSRDMGVSWSALGVIFWHWMFHPGFLALLGSKKEDDVDRSGDMRSLFEKLRYFLKEMPTWLRPFGFNWKQHSMFMRLINPMYNNSITGESANRDFGRAGRYKMVLLDEFAAMEYADEAWTACYSNDTEVLTDKGWKLFQDLKDELVLSMDTKTREAKYMPIIKKHKQFFDKLIHFKGKSIDLMVTENHQILYETYNGSLYFKDAHKFSRLKNGSIPLVCKYVDGENPEKIYNYKASDWMEFLGWYISEGSMCGSGTVKISQSQTANSANVARISCLLERMGSGFSYSPSGYFNVFVKNMSADAREELKSLGTSEMKFIPQKYLNLNKELLKSLWEGLLLGDGWESKREGRKNAIGYTTISKKLADQVQELIQKIGYKASVRKVIVSNTHFQDREIKSKFPYRYNVYLGFKDKANSDKLKNEIVDYKDNVYCVTTEYHTLYVRRNGVACWCGNTGDSTPCRVVVSTPKGTGNKFWQLRFKSNIDRFTAHWTVHPEKAKDAYLVKDKRKLGLAEAFELWKSGEKVSSPWYEAEINRRMTQEAQSKVDIKQELDVDYLASGDPYFEIVELNKQVEWTLTEDWLNFGDVNKKKVIIGSLIQIDGKLEFRPNKNGWLRLFERPRLSGQYIGALDPSEGLTHGDFAAGSFRDKKTRNLIAAIYGHFDYDELSMYGFLVSRYFNNCVICAEAGGYGAAVNKRLYDLGANVARAIDFSSGSNVEKDKLGFITGSTSRPLMLGDLAAEIREGACELRDKDLKNECMNFINNNGKPQAAEGSTDDFLMSFAIAGQLLRIRPYSEALEKEYRKTSRIEAAVPANNMGYGFRK